MLHNFKILFVVLVATMLAVTAYAFAAANTVPDTKAGDGAGTISGYTVSNVIYNLNASDPAVLDSVDLTLDAAAVNVKIKLVTSGSTWYDCTVVSGNHWVCDTSSPTQVVASMDKLEVIASGK